MRRIGLDERLALVSRQRSEQEVVRRQDASVCSGSQERIVPVHRFAVSASSHSRGALTSALPLVHFLKDVPRPALRLRVGHHVSYDDGARRSDRIHGGLVL